MARRLFLALLEGDNPTAAQPLVVSEDRRLIGGFLDAFCDLVGVVPSALTEAEMAEVFARYREPRLVED